MSGRWQWDFEAPGKPHAAPAAPPPKPPPAAAPRPPAQPPPRNRYLVRRGAALLVLAGVIALIVGLATSSSPQHASKAAATRAEIARLRQARAHVPASPENDLGGAVSAVLAYTPFVREGGASGHDVALTFDDGPGPYTPAVLSVLERYDVHATFFAIGKMERYFSASTVREIEDGDEIGDHTETHPMLAQLSAHDQREEIFEQMIRVETLGARRPTLFRPPYGSFDATTFAQLKRLHLLMVLWSVDTSDYQQPGVPAIVASALQGAHPGAIILMHDGGGVRTQTIEALPIIIRELRARGYHLVTVPQLLADDPPPHGLPAPTSLAGD